MYNCLIVHLSEGTKVTAGRARLSPWLAAVGVPTAGHRGSDGEPPASGGSLRAGDKYTGLEQKEQLRTFSPMNA